MLHTASLLYNIHMYIIALCVYITLHFIYNLLHFYHLIHYERLNKRVFHYEENYFSNDFQIFTEGKR